MEMDMKFVGKFNYNYDIRFCTWDDDTNVRFVVTRSATSWDDVGVTHEIYSWWDALKILDDGGMRYVEHRIFMEELDYRLYDICIGNVNGTTIAVTHGPDSSGYHATNFWLLDDVCNNWMSVTETEFCLINIVAGSNNRINGNC